MHQHRLRFQNRNLSNRSPQHHAMHQSLHLLQLQLKKKASSVGSNSCFPQRQHPSCLSSPKQRSTKTRNVTLVVVVMVLAAMPRAGKAAEMLAQKVAKKAVLAVAPALKAKKVAKKTAVLAVVVAAVVVAASARHKVSASVSMPKANLWPWIRAQMAHKLR